APGPAVGGQVGHGLGVVERVHRGHGLPDAVGGGRELVGRAQGGGPYPKPWGARGLSTAWLRDRMPVRTSARHDIIPGRGGAARAGRTPDAVGFGVVVRAARAAKRASSPSAAAAANVVRAILDADAIDIDTCCRRP